MLTIQPHNAAKIKEWMKSRGGIAVWRSINLSNPSGQWITPADASKPNWQADSTPEIITDPSQIQVERCKEVKRFHIALRHGSNNPFLIKLTDASTRKVNAACAKYPDSHYGFDYSTQEAVIYVPETTTPLEEYHD